MKNIRIQFALILISVSIFSSTTYSLDYKKYWKELNSTIELQGKVYDQCETGIRVLSADSGELCIRAIDLEKELDMQVYINIPITYDKEEKRITLKEVVKQPSTSSLYFTYKDWLDATHLIPSMNCEIYTLQFTNGKHLISGQFDLTTQDNSTSKVKFCVFDNINEIYPEVVGLAVYSVDMFKNNKGEININNKKTSMPYTIVDKQIDGITRIYLTDRLFMFNGPLDYAIRINFNSEEYIPIGNYTLSDESIESISIFNHGREEKVKTMKLEIKELKKKGYNIKYVLETESGEIIKGYFQGNLYSE